MIRAYEEQIAAVEKAGGRIILMASRALAKIGRSADDYAKVYDRVLSQVREPVIIHWLGDMFDPALANYWGTSRPRRGDGYRGRHHQRQRREGRWRQGFAARQAARDRHAPPARQGRQDVYRRRFQLCRTDRRRRTRLFACAARHLRCHRAGGVLRAVAAGGGRRARASTTCWGRRCRCRAISSRRRRGSTRPASCSWPISTAIRIISPWSAARRARARRCIWPNCFGWRIRPACSPIPNWRRGA